MPWRFQFRTAWVPLSLFFHAFTLSRMMSITEAKYTEGWPIKKPLIIGVPINTFSDQFVSVKKSVNNPDEKIYTGFCIDAFKEAVKNLSPTHYHLRHKFVEFNGSYDDLVSFVVNQTFDAAVGDITILAHRWRVVDFSAPFTESGIRMIVPRMPQTRNAWLFLKPFTKELWVATMAILMYTMFIFWWLVFRSNQEFCGQWTDQLSTVLWFTFSTLLFAHKERIQHNYTRVVMVVWLFLVLILTQSYTASLTSMLTVSGLDQNVDSLKKSNAVVGCYGNTFVRDYLENVLHFKKDNIREDIATQSHYADALKNGSISAAFLEVPYAKAIVNQHCNQLTVTGQTYKFGGFGFVFQKGSPIVDDVSAAILRLMEDGTLKKLEDEYFAPSSDCSNFQTAKNNSRLSLQNFWAPYIFYIAISTICLVLFSIHSLNNQRHRHKILLQECDITHVSAQKKILPFAQFSNNIADSRDRSWAPISDHEPIYSVIR
ncbi:glutamate receptor 2.8-like [Cornus florida]|uniref:glutamate receptor 2.8-like n=1 Tax=Cornus florida TaxID=4283 RepID=UPI00289C0ACD|nr:glutamate receptor 2.8-like [Cornus florida]